jgi:tRNA (guanine37-N1)-methyltransferase
MRFDIITLFPELFTAFLGSGVTRRAFVAAPGEPTAKGKPGAAKAKLVDVRLWNPRDFASGNYRRVDDRPFGGGPGMVMMAQPLADCLAAIREDRLLSAPRARASEAAPDTAEQSACPVILFSPIGKPLDHASVTHWAASDGAILVCGRYEGIDQRFIDAHVDVQISLGDFVLSGGEIAAMALLDALARLQPGVLNDDDSHHLDSFNPALDGLLDCPHYTRPEEWNGVAVPATLTSGHHGDIERWRRDRRLAVTAAHRPDLIEQARKAMALDGTDEAFLAKGKPKAKPPSSPKRA